MNNDRARHDDLFGLLSAWCSGQLSQVEAATLAALLRDDAEARQIYLDYVDLHADLVRAGSASHVSGVRLQLIGESPEIAPPAIASRRSLPQFVALVSRQALRIARRPTSIALATAFVVLGILIGGMALIAFPLYRQAVQQNPAPPQVVAKITRTHEAKWHTPAATGAPNGHLHAGDRLELREGYVEVLFYNGASVIVQGPADFRVVSPGSGNLEHGQLTALVPEKAAGFSIRTPCSNVVDLGTEFGMLVEMDGTTKVDVFVGRVEVAWIDKADFPAQRMTLGAGEAARIAVDASGIERVDVNPAKFVRSSALNKIIDEHRYQHWREFMAGVANDPSVAALYKFERDEQSPEDLHNFAIGRQDDRTGRILGAQWATGRWKEKSALQFQGGQDGVAIDLGVAPSEQLTLATWVRLDQLEHQYNALLHSNDWNRDGAVHWTVLADGRMELAIGGQEQAPPAVQSDAAAFGKRLGRWVHLAVVYDASAKVVSFYRNGNLQGTRHFTTASSTDLRQAQLGNWSEERRNLLGTMDEFIVYRRALDGDEIRRLYAAGIP